MESTSLFFFVAHILCGTSLGKPLGSYIQLDDAWSILKKSMYVCMSGWYFENGSFDPFYKWVVYFPYLEDHPS